MPIPVGAIIEAGRTVGKVGVAFLGARAKCSEREIALVTPKWFYRYERDSGPLFDASTGSVFTSQSAANAFWVRKGGQQLLKNMGVCQRILSKRTADKRTLFHEIRPTTFPGLVRAKDGRVYDASIFGITNSVRDPRKAPEIGDRPKTNPGTGPIKPPQAARPQSTKKMGPTILALIAGVIIPRFFK